ncbi:hypothetical protein DSO57_1011836 [Entomophthora muscae]|uniref:Uncharacterized protein n=1 Tax=Entomophthora muscae TaxID=34485 RepID=A0ACC2RKX0_9FUNG|nr:hypothetical protein DSO57_1011836 [Entomophthora muscae]
MPQETAPACQGLSLAPPLPSFIEKHGYKIESSDSESAPVFSVSNPVVVHPPTTVPLVMTLLPSVPEGPPWLVHTIARRLLSWMSLYFVDQETCWQLYWLYCNTSFQALQDRLAGRDHAVEYLAGFVQPYVKQLQLVAARHNLELLSLSDALLSCCRNWAEQWVTANVSFWRCMLWFCADLDVKYGTLMMIMHLTIDIATCGSNEKMLEPNTLNPFP